MFSNQMVEVGSTDTYTNSFLIPKGNSIYMNYQYSFSGYGNENGYGTNHVREIRTYGQTYVCPTDQWSWIYSPTNVLSYIVEQDFGNLAVGKLSGGNLPMTWLGRPGVFLENESDLTSGNWTTNFATDCAQSTNWPVSGSAQFFRLIEMPVGSNPEAGKGPTFLPLDEALMMKY